MTSHRLLLLQRSAASCSSSGSTCCSSSGGSSSKSTSALHSFFHSCPPSCSSSSSSSSLLQSVPTLPKAKAKVTAIPRGKQSFHYYCTRARQSLPLVPSQGSQGFQVTKATVGSSLPRPTVRHNATTTSSSSNCSSTNNSGNTPTTTVTKGTATTNKINTQGQQQQQHGNKHKLLRSLSSLPDHNHDEDDGGYKSHVRRVPRNNYIPKETTQLHDEGREYEHGNENEHEFELEQKQKQKQGDGPSVVQPNNEEEVINAVNVNNNNDNQSPSHISYLADVTFPITSELKIVKPNDDAPNGIWPVYRIMDENGTFRTNINDGYQNMEQQQAEQPSYSGDEDYDGYDHNDKSINALKHQLIKDHPQHGQSIQSSLLFHTTAYASTQYYKSFAETFSSVHKRTNSSSTSTNNNTTSSTTSVDSKEEEIDNSNSLLLRAHRIMTRLRQMDDVLLNAQRQGRISFYLTCRGEEGIHVGSASALSIDDVVLAQYREQGILMWRGFTLDQFTNQCFTNDLDLGRGRQMPIHYGSRALNYHTISSPLGTQLPQAVGVAYKMKLDKLARNNNHEASNNNPTTPGDKKDSISIVYFGDGAASTTDFHAALNFAATLKVPMIFFCRNNGYAISTKTTDQYASDGIVCRSRGYGMAAIRVDGNDIFAVHSATKAAREYAIEHSEPVLIEAISYRQGHHSTSDDSYQYRSVDEVNNSENIHDPLRRFEKFLMKQHWMDENDISAVSNEERMSVLKAMERSEKRPQPKLETMFQDVYKEMPLNLMIQEEALQKHMKKYPEKY